MDYHNSNRWKYYLGKAQIDVLWTIHQNSDQCVIYLLTGKETDNERCPNYLFEDNETCDCFNCIRGWLNGRS